MSFSTRFPMRRLMMTGAVVAVAACAPADTEPANATLTHDHTAPAAAPSAAKLGPDVSRALGSLRAATAKFHNVDAAIAAGYADPTGIPCVASPAGTMGIHVVNASLRDQVVTPDQPEILLYLPKANGGFKLVGVEYLVPALVRHNTTGVVSPWFATTPWGSDYTLITPTPSVFGLPFDGPMPPHEPGTPWHYDLHVWAWETNPSGIFTQWNPSISCPS